MTVGSAQIVGNHDSAISCIAWSHTCNALFTGSWDSSIKSWDLRASTQNHTTTALPGKVYSMSLSTNRLVVATSGRHILVYDVRNMSQPEQVRVSPLRCQTRRVACFMDGSAFAVGSVEVNICNTKMQQDIRLFTCKYAVHSIIPYDCYFYYSILSYSIVFQMCFFHIAMN